MLSIFASVAEESSPQCIWESRCEDDDDVWGRDLIASQIVTAAQPRTQFLIVKMSVPAAKPQEVIASSLHLYGMYE